MARDEAKAQERGYYQISLRLPLDLHAELATMRAEDERSLHAEIIWCVRQCAAQRRRDKRKLLLETR